MDTAVQTIIQFLPVAFFSVLAFWKSNAVLFMLTAGGALMMGLYWYDQHTTTIGLTTGLLLIAYSILCLGFAFRAVFWRNENERD